MKTTILILSLGVLAFTFSVKPSLKTAEKALDKLTKYIPSGNALVDNDTVSVQAFYMSESEITNYQYREFLNDLQQKGRVEDYKIAQIDSAKWNSYLGWENNTMMEHYHSHPSFDNYPVVNVSKEAANLFCDWLSAKYDSLSNGELTLKFRIPSRAEYIRAARGDDHYWAYSWGGPFLRNSEGQLLANFVRIGSESIKRDSTGKLEIADMPINYGSHSFNPIVIAPTKSYWPNTFGLYNMNGNVAEMVGDEDLAVGGSWYSPGYDIRIESSQEFTESNPLVGFRVVATHLQ